MNAKSNAICLAVLVLSLTAIASRAGEAHAEDPAVAALRAKLEKPATLRVSDVQVQRALGILAKSADFPIQILGKKDADAFDLLLNINVQNARAIDILDAIRDITKINYELRPSGVVLSTNGAPGEGPPVMRMYNVDDLITTVPDAGGELPEYTPTDHDGQSASFATLPTSPSLANIADMIRNRIHPEAWDPALGTAIEERSGVLVVIQHEDIQAQILQLLADFRARNCRQVGVDMRAISLASTEIDRIRREITQRGGAWPVLDAGAFASIDKLLLEGSAETIFDGSTILFNGQRGRLQNAEHRNLLVDYEISGDAYDPRMQRVSSGWTSLLQPVLSDDGSHVSMNLKISQIAALGAPEMFTIQRGGLIQAPGTPNTVTIRQRKTPRGAQSAMPAADANVAPEAVKAESPKAEAKADANPNAAPVAPLAAAGDAVPQPVAAVTAPVDDVTHEFDIQSSTQAGPPVQSAGPLQLQLQPMSVTRVKQDLVLPAGKSVAVCAPLGGKDGVEAGREMLTIVRCSPLNTDLPRAPGADAGPPDLQALTQKLQKPITLALGELPLPHAIQTLSIHTGIPVMIDNLALDARLQESVVMNFDQARGEDILNTILQTGQCSVVRYPSLLLFTTPDKAGVRGLMLRIFDIRELTLAHADYPMELGHELQAAPAQGAVCAIPAATGANCSIGAEDIAVLLKERLFPADFADPTTSIEESNNKLIVMQTPAVMVKIEKALNEFRDIRRRVNITVRWAVVNSADLRSTLGAEIPHTLDAAQAEKMVDLIAQPVSRSLATARLCAYHGQRVSAFGGVSRPAVVDYDVVGAALDPVVGTYYGGVKCELLPLVIDGTTPDNGQIMLSATLSLSKTDLNPATVDPLTPNARVAPSYPAQPGKIQLPKTQNQELFNSVRVGNGGAALFRLPVPAWLQGEDADAVKRGQRTMIVVLQAQIIKN